MTAALPAGYTFRRPSKDDVEAIYELVAACNTAAIGFADFTLDDMADELTEPGFDLDQDAWLVYAGETLVGYGAAYGKGDDHRIVDVDAYSAERDVAEWLLAGTTARGQALARANGLTEVSIDANTYRTETAKRELLADNGFTPTTTYQRMRIDHTGPVAALSYRRVWCCGMGRRTRRRGGSLMRSSRRASPGSTGSCRAPSSSGTPRTSRSRRSTGRR
ncbi:hypothetical protein [Kribbella sp. CA-294648]|uniref:hypothetical protein n=1 Tax=Kribbella sp. CA-294648 TaxID=3239948 RepID=UPI003D8B05F8